MKTVPVTLIIETHIEVLDDFDDHDVEFHLNDSSHCIDNEIAKLRTKVAEHDAEGAWRHCFCSKVHGLAGHRTEDIRKRLEQT